MTDCQESLRAEEAGEQVGELAEGDDQSKEGGANHAQLALLEMWMGLPGYGLTRGRAAEGEAAAALLRLRKALSVVEDPAASSLEGGSTEEGAEGITPASTLQVRETKVFSPDRRRGATPVVWRGCRERGPFFMVCRL